jgi:hypothetical protein
MIETIGIIVSVATGILSGIGTVKGLQSDRKNTISQFLNVIADTIDEAVVKFKNDEIPHGACERMRRYATEFPYTLEGYMETDKLQTYAEELHRAHEIEQLYKTVRDNPESIVELEKAASAFRVAANMIKFTK